MNKIEYFILIAAIFILPTIFIFVYNFVLNYLGKEKKNKPKSSMFDKFRYLDAIFLSPRPGFSGQIYEPYVVVRKIDTNKYLVFRLFKWEEGKIPSLFEWDTTGTGTKSYQHLTKHNPSFNKHWYEYYINNKKKFDIDLRKYHPDLFDGSYDIKLKERKRKEAEQEKIERDILKFISRNKWKRYTYDDMEFDIIQEKFCEYREVPYGQKSIGQDWKFRKGVDATFVDTIENDPYNDYTSREYLVKDGDDMYLITFNQATMPCIKYVSAISKLIR